MIVYIPIKNHSQRVPNKNFRQFNGVPLWENTVDKLKGHKVYVDTDSDLIMEKCKPKEWVECFYRKRHLLGDAISVVDLLKIFLEKFSISVPLCQLHVTSPFLNCDHFVFAE